MAATSTTIAQTSPHGCSGMARARGSAVPRAGGGGDERSSPSTSRPWRSRLRRRAKRCLPRRRSHPASGLLACSARCRDQAELVRQSLPFYVSSWWRRGDLSWVMYLNAFVLLLVAGTVAVRPAARVWRACVAQRFAGGSGPAGGSAPPSLFHVFALLESIKSSIGIWWEKAQGSLEVLLYTPVDDPSLIWLEVLPGRWSARCG